MNRLSQTLQELQKSVTVLEIHSPDYTGALRFPASILQDSFERYLSRVVYKPDPRGSLRARQAVSGYYARAFGLLIDPDDILLTCGTSESYAWIIRGFGHEVSVPVPSYPLLDHILEYCGSMQSRCHLTDSWQIEQMPEADLALLISPHNPTGSILTERSLALAEESVARRKGAVVLDEVFSSFIWDDTVLARPRGDLSFTLNGASKLLCLPWLKLSWIVCGGSRRRSAMEKLELIADTFLPVNGFAEDALPELFRAMDEFHPALCAELRENRMTSYETLMKYGLSPALPQAGFSMVVDIGGLRPELSEEEFAVQLLLEEQVCVHPGYFYDFESDKRRFVFSFQNKKGLLAEALFRIGRFVSRG